MSQLTDFFKSESHVMSVKALGFQNFETDTGKFAKIFHGQAAPEGDANRHGIIPLTIDLDYSLVPALSQIESFPCDLELEVINTVGKGNKTTQRAISIKGGAVANASARASSGK